MSSASARAKAWLEEWLCVDHAKTCSRVIGTMPLPAFVNVETGRCDECHRAVSPPKSASDSLAALLEACVAEGEAKGREDALEEAGRIADDIQWQAEGASNECGEAEDEEGVNVHDQAALTAKIIAVDIRALKKGEP